MRRLALVLIAAAHSVASGQTVPQPGSWVVDSTVDPMTGKATVAALLHADSLVAGHLDPVAIGIRVACDVEGHELSVAVFTTEAPLNLFLSSSSFERPHAQTMIKFGDGPAEPWPWAWVIQQRPGGWVLLLDSGGKKKEFLKRIVGGSGQVLFRYRTLWNGEPTASFTLPPETQTAVGTVSAACGK